MASVAIVVDARLLFHSVEGATLISIRSRFLTWPQALVPAFSVYKDQPFSIDAGEGSGNRYSAFSIWDRGNYPITGDV